MTSQESRLRLIQKWGEELVLKCSCSYWKSHSLWGQYGAAKFSQCRTICEVTDMTWEEYDNRS